MIFKNVIQIILGLSILFSFSLTNASTGPEAGTYNMADTQVINITPNGVTNQYKIIISGNGQLVVDYYSDTMFIDDNLSHTIYIREMSDGKFKIYHNNSLLTQTSQDFTMLSTDGNVTVTLEIGNNPEVPQTSTGSTSTGSTNTGVVNTSTGYVFSGAIIFNDINYESLNREVQKELLNIYLSSSGGTIETINYKNDLNDIKNILFQILLLLFVFVFFNLTWIFYTFYNDIIGKK